MRLVPSSEFWTWRQSLSREAKAAIDDALSYLAEFGRSAALPYVRHRIQTSQYFPDMSEIRVVVNNRFLRGLVSFEGTDLILLLVGGDKTDVEDDWYRSAVPAADQLITEFRSHQQRGSQ